jgi:hypothetical protein
VREEKLWHYFGKISSGSDCEEYSVSSKSIVEAWFWMLAGAELLMAEKIVVVSVLEMFVRSLLKRSCLI